MQRKDQFIFGAGIIGVIVLIIFAGLCLQSGAEGSRSKVSASGIKTMATDDGSIYQDSPDLLGLSRSLEAEKTTNENAIEGVTPALAIIIDDLIQLYTEKNYDKLFEIVNHDYLKSMGAVLNKEMFLEEQKKLVGSTDAVLSARKCVEISNYSLCELEFIDNGSRVTFTLFPNKEGFTYLPFNIDDMFVVSDYGVSRITESDEILK